ncbi:DsrE family protein [Sulfurimonas sp.]|uniref:DsrE family protein n=1 Tax=Sulfurimonas sp. TaxID=2022749 RepID=UPI0026210B85|nr:DsrE family protein [Sulfurimonas sp.]
MLKFTLILLSFCILSFADTEYAEPKPSIDNPRQIVFSVTEDTPQALDHILSVANNVLKFYGPEKVEMKIVAYSKGIKVLDRHNKTTAVRVDALMQYDVEFVACGNTMRTLHIKEEDLVEGSIIVTAGVVELLESVKAGWIYIKP